MDFDGFRSDTESGGLARGSACGDRALDAFAAHAVGSYPASNPSSTKRPAYQDDVRRGIDYHAVLGIPETANEEELLSAFRARIRAVHPDLNAGVGDRATLELLVRARQTLTGPDRAAYLSARGQRVASPPEPERPSASPTGTQAEPHLDFEELFQRAHAARWHSTPPGSEPRHAASEATVAEGARQAEATREDLRRAARSAVEIPVTPSRFHPPHPRPVPAFRVPASRAPHFPMPHDVQAQYIPTPYQSTPYRPPSSRRPTESK